MAEETEISTPEVETVETTSSDEVVETTTSSDEVVETTTSDDEVTSGEATAETETGNEGNTPHPSPLPQGAREQTTGEGELLAGKYKTVEELVKGYNELQK